MNPVFQRHRVVVARKMFKRLWRTDRGSVVIEFVFLVPLMLFILVGFSELYMYMRTVSMVEHTAFTLADSIGQMSQVVDNSSTSAASSVANSLGAIYNAATLLAAPVALQSSGAVVVTSVYDKTASTSASTMAAGSPGIRWQRSAPWNASGLATQETSTSLLPTTWPFRNGDSAVVVEVFYSYQPFTMSSAIGLSSLVTKTIYQRVYVRPRYVQTLELVSS